MKPPHLQTTPPPLLCEPVALSGRMPQGERRKGWSRPSTVEEWRRKAKTREAVRADRAEQIRGGYERWRTIQRQGKKVRGSWCAPRANILDIAHAVELLHHPARDISEKTAKGQGKAVEGQEKAVQ